MPETPLPADATHCQPTAIAGRYGAQGTTEVTRENKMKGLEWNVREEPVPWFPPKVGATSLCLHQSEPHVENWRWRKESRSRLETPLTVVVVGGIGPGEALWLGHHVQYLPKPYQFAV